MAHVAFGFPMPALTRIRRREPRPHATLPVEGDDDRRLQGRPSDGNANLAGASSSGARENAHTASSGGARGASSSSSVCAWRPRRELRAVDEATALGKRVKEAHTAARGEVLFCVYTGVDGDVSQEINDLMARRCGGLSP